MISTICREALPPPRRRAGDIRGRDQSRLEPRLRRHAAFGDFAGRLGRKRNFVSRGKVNRVRQSIKHILALANRLDALPPISAADAAEQHKCGFLMFGNGAIDIVQAASVGQRNSSIPTWHHHEANGGVRQTRPKAGFENEPGCHYRSSASPANREIGGLRLGLRTICASRLTALTLWQMHRCLSIGNHWQKLQSRAPRQIPALGCINRIFNRLSSIINKRRATLTRSPLP